MCVSIYNNQNDQKYPNDTVDIANNEIINVLICTYITVLIFKEQCVQLQ